MYAVSVQTNNLDQTINVHPFAGPWAEKGITWMNAPGYGTAVAGAQFTSLSNGSWVAFNVPTNLVQQWLDNPAVNYGLLVKPNFDGSPGYSVRRWDTACFASKEAPNPAIRPKLRIGYTPPAMSNVKPMAIVVSPDDNSVSSPGQNVCIVADASDADGTVTCVQFYADGALIGQCADAPYTCTWRMVQQGTYALTARVYDNGGACSTSAPVILRTQWTIYSADMTCDPGWTFQGSQWAYGRPMGGGGHTVLCDTPYGQYFGVTYPDPSSGYQGTNVVGYNLNGDFGNFESTEWATTPGIDCSGHKDVRLHFYYWLGVLSADYWGHASVQVSNDGSAWSTVWENPYYDMLSGAGWCFADLDISQVANGKSTVYVRWGMGPNHAGTYPICGWNIDEVRIVGTRTNVPPDLTHDGMADEWQVYYFGTTNTPFGRDADGDGFCDLYEYIAGTDPVNPGSRFALSITNTNGQVVVSLQTVGADAFHTGYRRLYSLESCTNVTTAQWSATPGCTRVPGNNAIIGYTNATGGSTQFYRAKVWLE